MMGDLWGYWMFYKCCSLPKILQFPISVGLNEFKNVSYGLYALSEILYLNAVCLYENHPQSFTPSLLKVWAGLLALW